MKDEDNDVEGSVWCNQRKKDMENEFSDTNSIINSQQIGSNKLIATCGRKGTDTTLSWTQCIIEISDKSINECDTVQ